MVNKFQNRNNHLQNDAKQYKIMKAFMIFFRYARQIKWTKNTTLLIMNNKNRKGIKKTQK